MMASIGIRQPREQPICHFARYQEVVAWPILPMR